METATKRDPRGQGERGEGLAAAWFIQQGAIVLVPFLHTSRHFDFIVEWDERIHRIQVKTSALFTNGRWAVAVSTRGGNRSWSGLVKYLDPSEYDYLFVVVGDGRRWLIPGDEVEARSGLHLGGPKYARFELDQGPPLVVNGSALNSAIPWRGSRAVKGDGL